MKLASDADRAKIVELEQLCNTLLTLQGPPLSSLQWIATAAAQLAHPLQPIAAVVGGKACYSPARLAKETQAFAQFGREVLASLRAGDLVRFEVVVASALIGFGGHYGLRRRDVTLEPDANGVVVRFPSFAVIRARLLALGEFLALNQGSPAICGLAAQVAILNLHPLEDGNGRLSRILCCSALLEGGYRPDFYLPVYALRQFLPFRFEIALRSAELHGVWADLAEIYIQLAHARLTCGLGTQPCQ